MHTHVQYVAYMCAHAKTNMHTHTMCIGMSAYHNINLKHPITYSPKCPKHLYMMIIQSEQHRQPK